MTAVSIVDEVRLSRPQPLGILPFPVGLLVLPGETSAELLTEVVGSRFELTGPHHFYRLAQAGDWASARSAIEGCQGPIAEYNKFILHPTAESRELLRNSLSGELQGLLEIAAFHLGLEDTPPDTGRIAAAWNGELLALALLTDAIVEIEREATPAAIALLERAVNAARAPSPLFASQLLAQLAILCKAQPQPLIPQALQHYREAIQLVAADLPEMRSELWMQLAITAQENAQASDDRIAESVRAYQEVLRSGLLAEQHPDLFALAHNNLGLLYLSMRMSEAADPLRMAIAVQSFREGLRLCDRERNPELWSSIQLNLANSLQYLTSSHPQENLVQAVELYEELITVRKKAFDPVGYGRILSNQANALAHLGIFPPALEKLQEARKLFEWHNEPDLAATAMDLVSKIHEQSAAIGAASRGN